MKNTIEKLIKKGVKIPTPESVFVSEDVNIDRISGENVVIYGGCKIFGEKCLIMKNSQIGHEAPVTLENSILGENTKLHGGYFSGAVFAGNNTFGSGAHVRSGTILEEESSAAHSVGLKQTILFPFVTLGSLINFCDCFMAGGTDRKNHSEVGSSFVHFNYTPHQDKATPSMMGDVYHGVMLNSRPIFLGGQGGIVGPVRIAYGCITAAGSIIRKNELRNDRLLVGGSFKEVSIERDFHTIKNIEHIFNNNIHYIAGLFSLKSWYRYIRPQFCHDFLSDNLVKELQGKLDECILERISRLKDFCRKLEFSRRIKTESDVEDSTNRKSAFDNAISKMEIAEKLFHDEFTRNELNKEGELFIKIIEKMITIEGKQYINVIKRLGPDEQRKGSSWLFDIERKIVEQLMI